MEPKKLYTVSWTQPYNFQSITLEELESILDMCIEAMIEEGDLTEAQQEIERIMKL
jgi:predicted DNA-binding ArsR family transcriptional regulator